MESEESMCGINEKIDLAFKKLFGSEENKDILISFREAFEAGFREGFEKGKLEEKLRAIRSLKDILDIKILAEKFELSIEEVEKITNEEYL